MQSEDLDGTLGISYRDNGMPLLPELEPETPSSPPTSTKSLSPLLPSLSQQQMPSPPCPTSMASSSLLLDENLSAQNGGSAPADELVILGKRSTRDDQLSDNGSNKKAKKMCV